MWITVYNTKKFGREMKPRNVKNIGWLEHNVQKKFGHKMKLSKCLKKKKKGW